MIQITYYNNFALSSKCTNYIEVINCKFNKNQGMTQQQEIWEEEIKKHHEKWKKWKMELKLKDAEKKKKDTERQILVGKPEDNAREYARKLIEKLEEPELKDCPISKNVADELQTNTCTICFQLMAPPNVPYILFPCGHNICKLCLFSNGDKKQQKYILKLEKCPLCRVKISNQAQNRNLMKLICSYMNKKELLEKQLQNQAKQKEQTDNIAKLAQHCSLLDGEKRILNQELQDLKKGKKVLEQVIDRLLDERRRCRKQLDALEDESRLINKHLNQKEEQMDKIQMKINDLEEKQHTIEATLGPLKSQKDKLQLEQATNLIKKK